MHLLVTIAALPERLRPSRFSLPHSYYPHLGPYHHEFLHLDPPGVLTSCLMATPCSQRETLQEAHPVTIAIQPSVAPHRPQDTVQTGLSHSGLTAALHTKGVELLFGFQSAELFASTGPLSSGVSCSSLRPQFGQNAHVACSTHHGHGWPCHTLLKWTRPCLPPLPALESGGIPVTTAAPASSTLPGLDETFDTYLSDEQVTD